MSDGSDEAKFAKSWGQLMVKLVALRGDPDVEAFLVDKHKELQTCAVPLDVATGKSADASDGTTASEAQHSWFLRKLKGQAGSQRERRQLCKMLLKSLRRYAAKYETPSEGSVSACDALKDGGAQEGPIICAGLAAGLAGTRFEGMRIARERPGIYQLGDKPIRVAVQADLEGGALLVHGYFDGDVLHPVRAPVRAFLEEHGAAPPSDQCDMFGGSGGGGSAPKAAAAPAAANSDQADDQARAKRARELPPGWVKRESRSKPGLFYYVNEAKGLSQMERPTD
mmetsp:Transcript_75417/g.170734  ORF Transcript_75417/g.170734 Transcript_75417/m.170734 type:complete len:282 (-) Transcript_75417:125-970(-)